MELLENVLSVENLNKAYQQVYRNKGVSGVDGVTVEELKTYLKEHKEGLFDYGEECKVSKQGNEIYYNIH